MTDPVARGQGTGDFWRAACSEFPNDNPELHSGAVWICPAPRARPRAVLRATAEEPRSEPRRAARASIELDFVEDDVAPEPLQGEPDDLEAETSPTGTACPSHAAGPLELACATAHSSPEPQLVAEPAELELSELVAEEGAEPQAFTDALDARGEDAWDSLLWRSQLESQDPFLTELAQLLASEDAPVGLFGETRPELEEPHAVASASNQACEALEPLTLEGFVTGEVLPLASAPQPVQTLHALSLPGEIERISTNEQSWDALSQSLVRFLMARGLSHAAIVLPGLLTGRAVNLARLPRAAQQCLIAEDFASEHDGAVLVRPEFRARARRLYQSHAAGTLDSDELARFVATVMRALMATALDSAKVLEELRAAGAQIETRAA